MTPIRVCGPDKRPVTPHPQVHQEQSGRLSHGRGEGGYPAALSPQARSVGRGVEERADVKLVAPVSEHGGDNLEVGPKHRVLRAYGLDLLDEEQPTQP